MIITTAIASIALLSALQQGAPSPPTGGDLAPVVQRIATTVQLAAQEYRIGVQGGRIIAPAEVEEAALFLAEARRTADRLPPESAAATILAVDALIAAVGRTADPDSIALGARALTAALADRFHVDLDQVPAAAPSLARGAQVYQQYCAGCRLVRPRRSRQGGRSSLPLSLAMPSEVPMPLWVIVQSIYALGPDRSIARAG